MNWCIHTPLSDIQQGWYAGITSPLGIAGYFQQDCLYSGPCNAVSDRANLHTSVIDFSVYTSVRDFLVYTSVRDFSCLYQRYWNLFIKYTSAPVEVSVWLGGKALKSVFVAFCVQDAVKDE